MKLQWASNLSGLPAAVIIALLGAGLLAWSDIVAEGIRRGISICGGVLVPALFPFMVLCCFLSRSGAARVLSLPLAPLTRHIYKLPPDTGAAVLLSLIGGYPVGAKMISGLLEQERIDKTAAERMLCFCVNASPSFLISAVGAGMLRDIRAGAVLFVSHIAASLLLGAAVSLRTSMPPPAAARGRDHGGGTGAFVAAVADASSSMLAMCALTVLFSGLLALLSHSGLPGLAAQVFSFDPAIMDAVAAGLLEVSGGCLAAASLGGEQAVALISVFCSFSGLSVIFQVISFFEKNRLRLWPLLAGRLAHCALALSLTLPLYRRFCADIAVTLSPTPPVLHFGGKTALITLCLVCMCGILVSDTVSRLKR